MRSRIKDARLAKGLTLKELAGRLRAVGYEVTPAGISKYEVGKSTPPPTFLHALGAVVGVKASHLASEPTVAIDWLTFRKRSRLTKTGQLHVQAYAAGVVEKQVVLHETLCPPAHGSFPKPQPCTAAAGAEQAAERLRKKWNLGLAPIESVTEVIEDRGGVVVEYPHEDRRFDGLCGWANKTYPVVVVSADVPDDRRRHTLAHELGHLVMDCSAVSPKEEEALAHRFAGAFIVPAPVALRELGEKRRSFRPDELAILKQKHGLSMQGWVRRAMDLDIITKGHYESLCREFSSRGWRKREPVRFEGSEKPTHLRQLVLRALAEGILTPSRAEEIHPGVQAEDLTSPPVAPHGRMTPTELLRLPREERREHLATCAASVAEHYSSERD